MSKPIVGVMPLWDEEKDSIWMKPDYMDSISRAGGIPVIFPFTEDGPELKQLINICDGFLLTGGHDVSPQLYNEEPLPKLVDCCLKRDLLETIVLREAIAADKPVLGICRGIQFINAALGGSLYQDLPSQYDSDIKHRQDAPREMPGHEVVLTEGTPLQKCLGLDILPVNSFHHQAVKDISPELTVMATSTDGIIEAAYRAESRFLWAVQWHPEGSYKNDENSRKIFDAFVRAMA